jgi:ornithine cyclodeaminase/alanine dehydrogenase-like protein (mu-crystallin family)
MRFLSAAEVEALLDLDALVDAVAAAMADLSAGRASVPPRIAALVPERDALLVAMPAHLPSANALTTKLVSLFPQNRDLPTHQAVICVFDPATGTPAAVMDGRVITEARTAAGSALSARFLARDDARTFAVIGTGAQAHAHARALARDARVDRLLLAGRRQDAVELLADAVRADLAGPGPGALPGGRRVEVAVASSVEAAVREADVVSAATHAADPVLQRAWLRPGTHVTSVGFNSSGEGEVDGETVRDAILVVESRSAAFAPPPTGAIELARAMERGLIGPDHARAEIGELVAGTAKGRTAAVEITLYKSVGVAAQDAAAAMLVLRAAEARGVGTTIRL